MSSFVILTFYHLTLVIKQKLHDMYIYFDSLRSLDEMSSELICILNRANKELTTIYKFFQFLFKYYIFYYKFEKVITLIKS